MQTQDEALSISNPRLLTAIYFGLLAILLTFLIHTFLSSVLGITQLLPIFQAILLAVPIAAVFGALFGRRIILCQAPYLRKAFYWACVMILMALPVYDVGFVYLFGLNHPTLYAHASLLQMLLIYLFVVLDSFILVGIWLMVLAGFAALFLRGYLVYYILHSLND